MIVKRNYVVLYRPAGDPAWRQFTAAYASSRSKALDQALAIGGIGPGHYQAIPARSWRPQERILA